MSTVAIPDDFDLEAAVKEGVKEAFADAAQLKALKEKPFLTEREVCRLYGLLPSTLKAWRLAGKGPCYCQRDKFGPVRYTHEAIREFMSGHSRGQDTEGDPS